MNNLEDDSFQEVVGCGLYIKTIHNLTIVVVDILIMHSVRGYRCFNFNRMGHIARNCRAPKQQYLQQRSVGNKGRGGYQNRVSAVNQ